MCVYLVTAFNRDFENLYLSSGQNGSEDSNGMFFMANVLLVYYLWLMFYWYIIYG